MNKWKFYRIAVVALQWFINHMDWFNERQINTVYRIGSKFYSKWRKKLAVDTSHCKTIEEAEEVGINEPERRFKMLHFCTVLQVFSGCAEFSLNNGSILEKNYWQLGIPINSGIGIAAFFYRPIFYLNLFLALFDNT